MPFRNAALPLAVALLAAAPALAQAPPANRPPVAKAPVTLVTWPGEPLVLYGGADDPDLPPLFAPQPLALYSNYAEGTPAQAVSLPFPFKFYGVTRTAMTVHAAGYVTFAPDLYDGDWNQPLESFWVATIAPYWDSIRQAGPSAETAPNPHGFPKIRPDARIYYDDQGLADPVHGRFVAVTWRNHEHEAELEGVFSPTLFSFQMLLFEDGTIRFNYLDVQPPPLSGGAWQNRSSPSVGVSNGDGAHATTIYYVQNDPEDPSQTRGAPPAGSSSYELTPQGADYAVASVAFSWIFPGGGANPAEALTALWQFGDGTFSQPIPIADRRMVEAPPHAYTGLGSVYTATLTIADAAGLRDRKEIVVRVLPDDLPTRIQHAVQENLRYLYQHQRDDGSWRSSPTDPFSTWLPIGPTGLALLALENQGHLPSGDPSTDMFVEPARAAADYLLANTGRPWELLALAGSGATTPETEPNGDAASATSAALGDDVSGTIDAPGDEDWYRLSVGPDDRFEIRLELDTLDDAWFEVRDPSGSVMTFPDRRGQQVSEIPPRLPAQVQWPWQGEYTIRVVAPAAPAPSGTTIAEPAQAHATAPDAVAVGEGDLVTGALAGNEQDWYAFAVSDTAPRMVSLVRTAVTAMPHGFDLMTIEVLDGTGSVLAAKTLGTDFAGNDPSAAFLDFTPPSAPATYYLRVRPGDDDPTWQQIASDEGLAPDGWLTYAALPASGTTIAEAEPNDDRATTARPLALGDDASGTIAGGDDDWFAVSLPAGEGARFRLASGSPPIAALTVYDEAGGQLGGPAVDATIPPVAAPATVYVHVGSSFTRDALTGGRVAEGPEPNDTRGRARVAHVGDTLVGRTDANDRDVYSFTAKAGTWLQLVPRYEGGETAPEPWKWLVAQAWDANGNFLTGSGGTTPTRPLRIPSDGTYYAAIWPNGMFDATGQVPLLWNNYVLQPATGATVPEVEPDDDAASATPIAPGDAASGEIAAPGDVDCFSLLLRADDRVDVTFTAAPADAALELIDFTGQVIASGTSISEARATFGGRYTIRVSAPGTGPYALATRFARSASYMNYEMDIQPLSPAKGAYTLSARATRVSSRIDYELRAGRPSGATGSYRLSFRRLGDAAFLRAGAWENMYDQGIATMALIGTLAPDAIARTGGAGVRGRPYRDIIREMIDFIIWAQTDTAPFTGGWHYGPHTFDADGSVSQWPIIALYEAENVLGIAVPDEVKSKIESWLHYSQNVNDPQYAGGAGYMSDTNWVTSGKTGGLLVGYRTIGSAADITRAEVEAAFGYIGRRWAQQVGTQFDLDMYDVYSIAKAFRVWDEVEVAALDPTGTVLRRKWYPDLAKYTIARLQPDGSISNAMWIGDPHVATTWSLLTLTQSVIGLPPVANAGERRRVIPDFQDVRLDASASFHMDARKKIVLYEWDVDGDGRFDGPRDIRTTEPVATIRYNVTDIPPGETVATIPVTLRVSDDSDALDPEGAPLFDDNRDGKPDAVLAAVDSIDVVLTFQNVEPVAVAGPAQGYGGALGQTIAFDGSASYDPNFAYLTRLHQDDPANNPAPDARWDIALWEWDLDGDGVFERSGPDLKTVSRTYAAGFDGFISLRVTDGDGASATSRAALHVANAAPLAVISSYPAYTETRAPGANFEIAVSGAGSSDPEGQALTYFWQWPGGFKEVATADTTLAISPGEHQEVTLIVSDGQNDSAPVSVFLSAGTDRPIAAISGPRFTTTGGVITLQDASTLLHAGNDYPAGNPDADAIVDRSWSVTPAATLGTPGGTATTFSAAAPGSYDVTLIVTDRYGEQASATRTIVVDDQVPAAVRVDGISSSIVAGTPAAMTVTVVDASGNPVTAYSGTLALTSTDPLVSMPATLTLASGDAGTKTVGVTLKTAGSQTITATDVAEATLKGTHAPVTVLAGATTRFGLRGIPATIAAGTGATMTVEAQDAYGNRTAGYTGTATLSSSDAKAVLPAQVTFATGDAGQKTGIAIELRTAGTQTVSAADGAITGSHAPVKVRNGPARSLVLTGVPSPIQAGAAALVTVTVRDVFGNRAADYSGTVRFSASDARASLPSDATFATADAGRKDVAGLRLRTAGTQAVSAVDTADATIQGDHAPVQVVAGSFAGFTLTGLPDPYPAGETHVLTVAATDAAGNVIDGYAGSADLTSSDLRIAWGAAPTLVFGPADHGVRTISVTLKTQGPRNVVARDAGDPTKTGVLTVAVEAGAPYALAFSTPPRQIAAGAASEAIGLQIVDRGGNIVAAGAAAHVLLFSTSPSGRFAAAAGGPFDGTFAALDIPAGANAATFFYRDPTAGAPQISADASAAGLLAATQTEAVLAGPPVGLVFTNAPATLEAGTAATITIALRDAFENAALAAAGGIAVDLATTSPGGGFAAAGTPAGGSFASPGAVLIAAGASSADFAYLDARPGIARLIGTSGALAPAATVIDVGAGSFARLVLSGPTETYPGVYTADIAGSDLGSSVVAGVDFRLDRVPPGALEPWFLDGAPAARHFASLADARAEAIYLTEGEYDIAFSVELSSVDPALRADAQNRIAGGFRVTVKNPLPVAAAFAPGVVAPSEEVALDARGSRDPNGGPMYFLWEQLEGPSVALDDPKSAQPLFTAPADPCVLRFRLTVNDAHPVTAGDPRNSAPADVAVCVSTPALAIPGADAGPVVAAKVGAPVVLDGSASAAADGSALGFSWRRVDRDGKEATPSGLDAPDTARPRFTAWAAGTYFFELRTTASGFTSLPARTTVVAIDPAGRSPAIPEARPALVAPEGREVVLPGERATLSAAQSRDDGRIVGWRWRQTAGVPLELAAADRAEMTVRPAQPDTYAFELVVTDDAGHESLPAEVSFEVLSPAAAGGASIAPAVAVAVAATAGVPEPLRVMAQVVSGTATSGPLEARGETGVPILFEAITAGGGAPVRLEWRQVAGAPVRLEGWTSAGAGFTPPVGGTYAFEVAALSTEPILPNATSMVSARSRFAVWTAVDGPQNHVPVAALAATNERRTVTLDASESFDVDAPAQALAYEFVQRRGPLVALVGDGAVRTFVAPADGVYAFDVFVVDSLGARSLAASASVEVSGPPGGEPEGGAALSGAAGGCAAGGGEAAWPLPLMALAAALLLLRRAIGRRAAAGREEAPC